MTDEIKEAVLPAMKVPRGLLERIDEYTTQLGEQARDLGLDVRRTDAVRRLLELGLRQVEAPR